MSTVSRPNMLAQLLGQPWALPQATLRAMVDHLSREPLAAEPRVLGLNGPQAQRPGTIPVYGVISHHPDALAEVFGGTSVDEIKAQLDAAMRDSRINRIVLDIDSPGGTVTGVTELAAAIRAMRGRDKPIVAVANSMAASAAYWLMAQADEAVVTPSGTVGSVGIYAVHQEASKALADHGITTTVISAGPHKTEGNEWQPLTDEAHAALQERADAFYAMFVGDVAKGRRISTAQVEATYGGGRAMLAGPALAAGMVDRIATLEDVLRGPARRSTSRMAAESPGEAFAAGFNDASGDVYLDGEKVGELHPARPFTERITALSAEADALVEHAQKKAALRAKEGRPAFSTTTETALRSIHAAIGTLLAVVDPPPVTPVVDPPPVTPVMPLVAAKPRFSHEEWLAYLQGELH